MDNLFFFDQNADPISFTLEAIVYCSKVATLTFYPMDGIGIGGIMPIIR